MNSPKLAALSPGVGDLDPKPLSKDFILLADRLEQVCRARRGENIVGKVGVKAWAAQRGVKVPRRGVDLGAAGRGLDPPKGDKISTKASPLFEINPHPGFMPRLGFASSGLDPPNGDKISAKACHPSESTLRSLLQQHRQDPGGTNPKFSRFEPSKPGIGDLLEVTTSRQPGGVTLVEEREVPCIKAIRVGPGSAQAQDNPDRRSEASSSSQQRAEDSGLQQPWASARGTRASTGPQHPQRDRRDRFWELVDPVRSGYPHQPRLNKTSANVITPGVEEILQGLIEPLGVVYTVDPKEVKARLSLWKAAAQKELNSLQSLGAIIRHRGRDAQRYLQQTGVTPIPAKVVWTAKPPDPGSATLYKRKARIVACGNHEPESGEELFAAGSSAEVLRAVLTEAGSKGWPAAGSDISTIPPGHFHALKPPSILETLELVEPGEIWEVQRAVYGYREAPRYWSEHRNATLKSLRFQDEQGRWMGLKQGSLESNLWTIHQVREGVEPESSSPEDFDPAIQGYLLVYVDDLLFLGPVGVTEFLHQKISSIWECSKLKFAHNRLDDEPLRFLGIEIKTCEGGFLLTQEAYISELLRAHEVNPSKRSKVPAPKEWLQADNEEGDADHAPDVATVRAAQRHAGELLWLAQRARPDLQYTVAIVRC